MKHPDVFETSTFPKQKKNLKRVDQHLPTTLDLPEMYTAFEFFNNDFLPAEKLLCSERALPPSTNPCTLLTKAQ